MHILYINTIMQGELVRLSIQLTDGIHYFTILLDGTWKLENFARFKVCNFHNSAKLAKFSLCKMFSPKWIRLLLNKIVNFQL